MVDSDLQPKTKSKSSKVKKRSPSQKFLAQKPPNFYNASSNRESDSKFWELRGIGDFSGNNDIAQRPDMKSKISKGLEELTEMSMNNGRDYSQRYADRRGRRLFTERENLENDQFNQSMGSNGYVFKSSHGRMRSPNHSEWYEHSHSHHGLVSRPVASSSSFWQSPKWRNSPSHDRSYFYKSTENMKGNYKCAKFGRHSNDACDFGGRLIDNEQFSPKYRKPWDSGRSYSEYLPYSETSVVRSRDWNNYHSANHKQSRSCDTRKGFSPTESWKKKPKLYSEIYKRHNQHTRHNSYVVQSDKYKHHYKPEKSSFKTPHKKAFLGNGHLFVDDKTNCKSTSVDDTAKSQKRIITLEDNSLLCLKRVSVSLQRLDLDKLASTGVKLYQKMAHKANSQVRMNVSKKIKVEALDVPCLGQVKMINSRKRTTSLLRQDKTVNCVKVKNNLGIKEVKRNYVDSMKAACKTSLASRNKTGNCVKLNNFPIPVVKLSRLGSNSEDLSKAKRLQVTLDKSKTCRKPQNNLKMFRRNSEDHNRTKLGKNKSSDKTDVGSPVKIAKRSISCPSPSGHYGELSIVSNCCKVMFKQAEAPQFVVEQCIPSFLMSNDGVLEQIIPQPDQTMESKISSKQPLSECNENTQDLESLPAESNIQHEQSIDDMPMTHETSTLGEDQLNKEMSLECETAQFKSVTCTNENLTQEENSIANYTPKRTHSEDMKSQSFREVLAPNDQDEEIIPSLSTFRHDNIFDLPLEIDGNIIEVSHSVDVHHVTQASCLNSDLMKMEQTLPSDGLSTPSSFTLTEREKDGNFSDDVEISLECLRSNEFECVSKGKCQEIVQSDIEVVCFPTSESEEPPEQNENLPLLVDEDSQGYNTLIIDMNSSLRSENDAHVDGLNMDEENSATAPDPVPLNNQSDEISCNACDQLCHTEQLSDGNLFLPQPVSPSHDGTSNTDTPIFEIFTSEEDAIDNVETTDAGENIEGEDECDVAPDSNDGCQDQMVSSVLDEELYSSDRDQHIECENVDSLGSDDQCVNYDELKLVALTKDLEDVKFDNNSEVENENCDNNVKSDYPSNVANGSPTLPEEFEKEIHTPRDPLLSAVDNDELSNDVVPAMHEFTRVNDLVCDSPTDDLDASESADCVPACQSPIPSSPILSPRMSVEEHSELLTPGEVDLKSVINSMGLTNMRRELAEIARTHCQLLKVIHHFAATLKKICTENIKEQAVITDWASTLLTPDPMTQIWAQVDIWYKHYAQIEQSCEDAGARTQAIWLLAQEIQMAVQFLVMGGDDTELVSYLRSTWNMFRDKKIKEAENIQLDYDFETLDEENISVVFPLFIRLFTAFIAKQLRVISNHIHEAFKSKNLICDFSTVSDEGRKLYVAFHNLLTLQIVSDYLKRPNCHLEVSNASNGGYIIEDNLIISMLYEVITELLRGNGLDLLQTVFCNLCTRHEDIFKDSKLLQYCSSTLQVVVQTRQCIVWADKDIAISTDYPVIQSKPLESLTSNIGVLPIASHLSIVPQHEFTSTVPVVLGSIGLSSVVPLYSTTDIIPTTTPIISPSDCNTASWTCNKSTAANSSESTRYPASATESSTLRTKKDFPASQTLGTSATVLTTTASLPLSSAQSNSSTKLITSVTTILKPTVTLVPKYSTRETNADISVKDTAPNLPPKIVGSGELKRKPPNILRGTLRGRSKHSSHDNREPVVLQSTSTEKVCHQSDLYSQENDSGEREKTHSEAFKQLLDVESPSTTVENSDTPVTENLPGSNTSKDNNLVQSTSQSPARSDSGNAQSNLKELNPGVHGDCLTDRVSATEVLVNRVASKSQENEVSMEDLVRMAGNTFPHSQRPVYESLLSVCEDAGVSVSSGLSLLANSAGVSASSGLSLLANSALSTCRFGYPQEWQKKQIGFAAPVRSSFAVESYAEKSASLEYPAIHSMLQPQPRPAACKRTNSTPNSALGPMNKRNAMPHGAEQVRPYSRESIAMASSSNDLFSAVITTNNQYTQQGLPSSFDMVKCLYQHIMDNIQEICHVLQLRIVPNQLEKREFTGTVQHMFCLQCSQIVMDTFHRCHQLCRFHMRVEPYCCETCNKGFYITEQFIYHLRNAHKELSSIQVQVGMAIPPPVYPDYQNRSHSTAYNTVLPHLISHSDVPSCNLPPPLATLHSTHPGMPSDAKRMTTPAHLMPHAAGIQPHATNYLPNASQNSPHRLPPRLIQHRTAPRVVSQASSASQVANNNVGLPLLNLENQCKQINAKMQRTNGEIGANMLSNMAKNLHSNVNDRFDPAIFGVNRGLLNNSNLFMPAPNYAMPQLQQRLPASNIQYSEQSQNITPVSLAQWQLNVQSMYPRQMSMPVTSTGNSVSYSRPASTTKDERLMPRPTQAGSWSCNPRSMGSPAMITSSTSQNHAKKSTQGNVPSSNAHRVYPTVVQSNPKTVGARQTATCQMPTTQSKSSKTSQHSKASAPMPSRTTNKTASSNTIDRSRSETGRYPKKNAVNSTEKRPVNTNSYLMAPSSNTRCHRDEPASSRSGPNTSLPGPPDLEDFSLVLNIEPIDESVANENYIPQPTLIANSGLIMNKTPTVIKSGCDASRRRVENHTDQMQGESRTRPSPPNQRNPSQVANRPPYQSNNPSNNASNNESTYSNSRNRMTGIQIKREKIETNQPVRRSSTPPGKQNDANNTNQLKLSAIKKEVHHKRRNSLPITIDLEENTNEVDTKRSIVLWNPAVEPESSKQCVSSSPSLLPVSTCTTTANTNMILPPVCKVDVTAQLYSSESLIPLILSPQSKPTWPSNKSDSPKPLCRTSDSLHPKPSVGQVDQNSTQSQVQSKSTNVTNCNKPTGLICPPAETVLSRTQDQSEAPLDKSSLAETNLSQQNPSCPEQDPDIVLVASIQNISWPPKKLSTQKTIATSIVSEPNTSPISTRPMLLSPPPTEACQSQPWPPVESDPRNSLPPPCKSTNSIWPPVESNPVNPLQPEVDGIASSAASDITRSPVCETSNVNDLDKANGTKHKETLVTNPPLTRLREIGQQSDDAPTEPLDLSTLASSKNSSDSIDKVLPDPSTIQRGYSYSDDDSSAMDDEVLMRRSYCSTPDTQNSCQSSVTGNVHQSSRRGSSDYFTDWVNPQAEAGQGGLDDDILSLYVLSSQNNKSPRREVLLKQTTACLAQKEHQPLVASFDVDALYSEPGSPVSCASTKAYGTSSEASTPENAHPKATSNQYAAYSKYIPQELDNEFNSDDKPQDGHQTPDSGHVTSDSVSESGTDKSNVIGSVLLDLFK